MTTTWDHVDHDPTSVASIASETRPTIQMRHMAMHGGGFEDRAVAGRKFHNIADANAAVINYAEENNYAMGGVIVETDALSLVPGAVHAVIHWGLVSDRYYLDTIDYALPGEL
jgi:hypothetical protein